MTLRAWKILNKNIAWAVRARRKIGRDRITPRDRSLADNSRRRSAARTPPNPFSTRAPIPTANQPPPARPLSLDPAPKPTDCMSRGLGLSTSNPQDSRSQLPPGASKPLSQPPNRDPRRPPRRLRIHPTSRAAVRRDWIAALPRWLSLQHTRTLARDTRFSAGTPQQDPARRHRLAGLIREGAQLWASPERDHGNRTPAQQGEIRPIRKQEEQIT
jgi:hypothetical protein